MVDSRQNSRSRRSDILAAAEREFATAGFAGARMDRIASQARVNKQLLFHYFDSKSGLLKAVLDSLIGRFESGPPPEEPAGALRHQLASLERLARQSPGLMALLAEQGTAAARPDEAAREARAWLARVRERLSTTVEDGQRRGYFRDDIDPATVAALGIAAALGTGAFGTGAPGPALAAMLQEYCAWR